MLLPGSGSGVDKTPAPPLPGNSAACTNNHILIYKINDTFLDEARGEGQGGGIQGRGVPVFLSQYYPGTPRSRPGNAAGVYLECPYFTMVKWNVAPLCPEGGLASLSPAVGSVIVYPSLCKNIAEWVRELTNKSQSDTPLFGFVTDAIWSFNIHALAIYEL